MSYHRPTVVLADDHPMMLEGLRKLLEPNLAVIATASDGLALLSIAGGLRPDLVLADVSMPGIDGIEATRRLATTCPETRVLILSFHTESSYVRAAFDAGAWGYLNKTAAADEIERAISEVLGGRFYVSPSVTRGLFLATHPPIKAPVPETPAEEELLTPREQEVVHWVGQGLPNKEIASRLGISVTTVRTHLSSAYEKLGHCSRLELALYAAQTEGAAS